MTDAPATPAPKSPAIRHRLLIRFRKEGDVRLISHRDLIRAMERLFRRASLPLGMSEGFRPKPRMAFPSALAVGIAGLDEVLELELAEPLPPEEVLDRLQRGAPPGMTFVSAVLLPPGAKKPQACRATFEAALPPGRAPAVAAAITEFLAKTEYACRREDKDRSIDLRPLVEGLAIEGETLRMILKVSQEGGARPREVLEAIGLADLESTGVVLVRTRVELA